MKEKRDLKKFLALFMAVVMVMASGIFVTTQSFKATDDGSYEDGVEENYEEYNGDVEEGEYSEEGEGEAAEEGVAEEEAAEEEVADESSEEAEPSSVNVVFNLNGADGDAPQSYAAEVVDDGGVVVGELPVLTDYTDGDGYNHIFAGWSVDENASEPDREFYQDGDELKLFAVWNVQEPAEEEAVEEEAAEEVAEEEFAEEPEEAVEEEAEEEFAEEAEEEEAIEETAEEEIKEEAEESKDEEIAEEASDEETVEETEEADQKEEAAEESSSETTDEAVAEEEATTEENTAEGEASEAQTAQQEDAALAEASQFPANSLTGKSESGVTVTASYGIGVFPEGVTMIVKDVSEEQAIQAVGDAVKDVTEAVAVDITFVDKEGNEIQPKDGGKVSVSLGLSKPLSGEDQTIIHVGDDGKAEKVSGSVDSNNACG